MRTGRVPLLAVFVQRTDRFVAAEGVISSGKLYWGACCWARAAGSVLPKCEQLWTMRAVVLLTGRRGNVSAEGQLLKISAFN